MREQVRHPQFAMGTAGGPTFLSAMRAWENHIIKYGEDGREIITKQRIPLLHPDAQDRHWVSAVPASPGVPAVPAHHGAFVYPHVLVQATQTVPEHLSAELTESGDRHLLSAIAHYRSQFMIRSAHASAMVSDLVNEWCSPQSLEAMDAEPTYAQMRSTPGPNGYIDSFAIHGLVVKVHNLGSSRAKYKHIQNFLVFSDQGLSLDAYIVKLRIHDQLVRDNFADPLRSDCMTFDNLLKVQFMQGLDQVVYARPLEHIKDNMADCTAAAAILYISTCAW